MTDFNIEPYWDDFEATNGAKDKNYMRIMFRPGNAVQARELTQIQSIIQNQIKQFGNHIFKDGSPVIGGQLSLDTSVTYIKVEKQYNGTDVDLTGFVGLTAFNSATPRTRARVIQSDVPTADDRVLMVKYLRGPVFPYSDTVTTSSGLGAKIISDSSTYTGTGSTISINEGVFYVNGFFVQVSPQTIVLDAYSASPTYRVGLEIDESFVDENDDTNLLDPAQNSFNFQAPGAARYKFNLVLAKRAIDSVDDRRFFELVRVENGIITRQVQYPVYSELEKTFARRTFDESGNYTVKPFRINISANTVSGVANNDAFNINIEPGKAYVKGFEFETIGTRTLVAPRARTTRTSKDYDLSAYYGNRVIVNDVTSTTSSGIGLASSLKEVDLHCVAADQVDVSGASQKYYATRIGTAKLKNFDRQSGTNYHAYLVDVKFDSMFAAANTNSAATNEVYLPGHFSSNSIAYVGATITMIDRFPGESRLVTGYDGGGKLVRLDRAFESAIQSGDRFTLTIPLSSTESIIRINESTFATKNLSANIAFVGKSTKDEAIFEDSNFQSGVFQLPYANIKRKELSDDATQFYLRTIRTAVSFTGTGAATITLSADEGEFDYGTNGNPVSSADILENIIIVPTTGTAAGQIVDMTAAGRSVTRNSSTQIAINTNSASGASFTADVYITTKLASGEDYRKTKTLYASPAALRATDTLSGTTSVVGYSDVKIHLTNGIVWHTTANVINKIPGEKQSLYISDVVKINKIYDSGSLVAIPTTSSTDITDRYILDSGQTDNYYSHASIILKPGAQPPKGQTAVLLEYFSHSHASDKGYISAGSYPQTVYDDDKIPVFVNKASKTFNLRDCIDLRPLRANGTSVQPTKFTTLTTKVDTTAGSVVVNSNTVTLGVQNAILSPPIQTGMIVRVGTEERKVVAVTNARSFNISSGFSATAYDQNISIVTDNIVMSSNSFLHRPTDPIQLDFDFYLPRIDKVVVTKDKDFKLIQGVPDIDPEEPTIGQDMMEIYKIKIPAYTAALDAINYQFVDNRGYTMRDIADLEKRIKNIERFVSLKEKEQATIKNPPQSGGVDKPIYGLIVDDFDNLNIVDQTKDFQNSIELGKLSCYKYIVPLKLKATDPDSVNVQDKFVSLPYTEVEMVSQKIASNNGNTQVQTAIIAKGEGFITLSPESDFFYDLNYAPLVTDASGRPFQVEQNTPDNSLDGYGDGNYPRRYNEDLRIVGDYADIFVGNRVNIPNFITTDPTIYEPFSTVSVSLNHAGVYYKQQDEGWSNKVTNSLNSMVYGGPNAYDESWNLRGYLTDGTEFYQQLLGNNIQSP